MVVYSGLFLDSGESCPSCRSFFCQDDGTISSSTPLTGVVLDSELVLDSRLVLDSGLALESGLVLKRHMSLNDLIFMFFG